MIPALRRQSQADLCELTASLVYNRVVDRENLSRGKKERERKRCLQLGEGHVCAGQRTSLLKHQYVLPSPTGMQVAG